MDSKQSFEDLHNPHVVLSGAFCNCLLQFNNNWFSQDTKTLLWHPYGCLEIMRTWMPLMDILTWRGRACRASTLEATEKCREQEKWPFLGKNTPISYPISSGQPWDHMDTGYTIYTEQTGFIDLERYVNK